MNWKQYKEIAPKKKENTKLKNLRITLPRYIYYSKENSTSPFEVAVPYKEERKYIGRFGNLEEAISARNSYMLEDLKLTKDEFLVRTVKGLSQEDRGYFRMNININYKEDDVNKTFRLYLGNFTSAEEAIEAKKMYLKTV